MGEYIKHCDGLNTNCVWGSIRMCGVLTRDTINIGTKHHL